MIFLNKETVGKANTGAIELQSKKDQTVERSIKKKNKELIPKRKQRRLKAIIQQEQ